MTFATPGTVIQPQPATSDEDLTFAAPGNLLGTIDDDTKVMTFGTDEPAENGSTNVVPFGSDDKTAQKETVTVPVADGSSVPSNIPDKTMPGGEKTLVNPENSAKPGEAAPTNALKLPKMRVAKETEFLAKLDPIKRATAQLQKKSVPGEKKLTTAMKRIVVQAQRAQERRLKATLRIIEKSKKIADAERSDAKKRVEEAAAKAKNDIDAYAKQLTDSVPKKMEVISNSQLYQKISDLLEKMATKQMDTVKELQSMTIRLQNGINKRFAAADAEMSKYTMK